MNMEYFNGWQQLDLDTNLDKSTINLQRFMKSETLCLAYRPPASLYCKNARSTKLNAHLCIQVSVVQQCKILETGSKNISSNYVFHQLYQLVLIERKQEWQNGYQKGGGKHRQRSLLIFLPNDPRPFLDVTCYRKWRTVAMIC